MKSGTKTAVSLIITILIFGGITVLSSLGMFSTVEKRFYEPARLSAINGKLDAVADCSNDYILNLLSQLGYKENGFLSDESVLSFVNQSPADSAVRLFDVLREKNPGIDGMRIVDRYGRRVHFSSYRNDYTIQGNKRNYSNYENLKTVRGKDELSYKAVSPFETSESEGEENSHAPRICFDGEEQRIIVSYKLFADEAKNQGFSVIFYVNPVDIVNSLIEKHIISLSEQLTLVCDSEGKSGGFVFGLPKVGQNIFAVEILKKWNENSFGPDVIVSTEAQNLSALSVNQQTGDAVSSENKEPLINWSLISSQHSGILKIGGVYSGEMLEMPAYVRILLLICAFITVCLIVVIIFNVHKDDNVVIKAKIKSVQIGLLNDYFEKDVDRKKVAALIEAQKDALTKKIKKSLGRRGKKYGEDLDVILNRSWEDIINILSGVPVKGIPAGGGGISSDDMSEIRKMFEEIISSRTLKAQAAGGVTFSPEKTAPVVPVAPAVSDSATDDVEEIECLEDAEPVEEVECLEDAEPVEEIEPLEDAEPVEEVECLEDAEPVEEVEPLEDAETVEEVECLEDAEPVEEIEPLEDAEPLDDNQPLQEIITLEGYDESFDVKDNSVTFVSNASYDRDKFEGSEPLQLGDDSFEKGNDSDVDDSFKIYSPFDSILDQEKEEKINDENIANESKVKAETAEDNHMPDVPEQPLQEKDSDCADLEELDGEKDGFMFTTFGANDNNVTDLPVDAIVMGDDGVFQISENLSPSNMPIDEEFKKLVDSVIR